nr:PREDICTED: GDSL esterase/lipase At2g40250-like [Musa acuminata subsp. malaccensis]
MTLSVVHSVVRTCVDEQNSDARHYNSKLKHLLLKTQQSLPGSKFVYLDLYDFLMEVLNNAAKHGFHETKRGCCGTGLFEVGPLCNRLNPACPDASRFVFYDAIHPSQRFYELITDYVVEDIIPHLRRRV